MRPVTSSLLFQDLFVALDAIDAPYDFMQSGAPMEKKDYHSSNFVYTARWISESPIHFEIVLEDRIGIFIDQSHAYDRSAQDSIPLMEDYLGSSQTVLLRCKGSQVASLFYQQTPIQRPLNHVVEARAAADYRHHFSGLLEATNTCAPLMLASTGPWLDLISQFYTRGIPNRSPTYLTSASIPE
jgi:hypothetical protein